MSICGVCECEVVYGEAQQSRLPLLSMSVILEVFVFADLFLGCLQLFVVAAARDVGEHLLVLVRKVQRVEGLLELPLCLWQLSASDGLFGLVSSWTRSIHFWNDPSRGWLWLSFANTCRKDLWLRHLEVSVVVLGSGVLAGHPFGMVSKVGPVVLPTESGKEFHRETVRLEQQGEVNLLTRGSFRSLSPSS